MKKSNENNNETKTVMKRKIRTAMQNCKENKIQRKQSKKENQ